MNIRYCTVQQLDPLFLKYVVSSLNVRLSLSEAVHITATASLSACATISNLFLAGRITKARNKE